jgi:hypothetical protein
MSYETEGDMEHSEDRRNDTLLRSYNINPGDWEPFLEVWRRIVAVRKRHGFEVLFALIDRKNNVFTWAVRHDGDINAAADKYYKDPDRIALEYVGNYVADYKVTEVCREPIP